MSSPAKPIPLVETPLFRWLLQAMACFVLVMQGQALWQGIAPKQPTPPGDFGQDWCSARNYWNHFPLYESMYQSVPRYIYTPKKELIEIPLQFNAHPPASILLMLPFGKLEYWPALQLWALFSVILFSLSIVLIFRELGLVYRWWYTLPMLALFLLLRPFYYVFLYGQWEAILVFLLTLSLICERRNRPIVAGVLAGLAASLKMFPLFFLLYFLVGRKYQSILAMLFTVACTNLLALSLFGWEVYPQWLHIVRTEIDNYKADWTNHSIQGFCTKFIAGSLSQRVWPITTLWLSNPIEADFASYSYPKLSVIVGYGLSLLLVSVYGWLGWRYHKTKPLHLYALTFPCMMLLSPVSWSHGFTLLLLPALLLWKELKRFPLLCGSLIVAFAGLLYSQGMLFDWFLELKGKGILASPAFLLTIASLDTYAVVLVLGLLIHFTVSSRETTAEPTAPPVVPNLCPNSR